MRTVYLNRSVELPGFVAVAFDYDAEAVALVKTMPGRKYHADTKTWHVPASFKLMLVNEFKRHGFTVHDGTTSAREPAGSRAVVPWAEGMFHALPDRLREPAHKALIRVLHPDAGGDTRAAQDLNAAFDRVRGAA